ncbi:uncharacterized protein LOC130755395 [Actinidia eriantha]|uniref:uncharacterized protein LOC130755395 n=1 Tax=Actinidia eriantha TaxID=165200 RepID=UPI002583A4B8|nr:uncharacterized protein LOC130755395 [Actinidia eriantha]XP_057465771.1 uncharacterized protein LOC130755395 [Actinidia eriantha]XP_057465777.1 uncharacterized protein LOC130755395 [Actinidia eriantha]XP_057465783.1 uncharacterized protein LOC130755395 [Actinidia eriantha]
MAADQRKKRLNTASIISSREQGRVKKKKLGSLQSDLNMRSDISLKWDDKKNSVVAKREQIGLTRRDLLPFIDYVPRCVNILADVLAVPHEIFELNNLKEVLSYEVWQSHLSENERNYLAQFLPQGAETHQVVQELLAGDNFHFGCPFLKWGASLCSGNLHPDVVIHQERYIKTSKKLYFSELQKYHNGMIGNLLMWKERWASCEDLEEANVDKIWRSRKQAVRNISAGVNECKYYDYEEDLAATSESGSWAADEKAGSSDSQILMRKHGELQKRKGFTEDIDDNSLAGRLKVVARPRKVEKLKKLNIQRGDGSKYMSYIKVSREQHQHVKSSIKHSGNSILSRSLNRVLGNLDTFQVQPFEVFEEEERKNLHQHWLQLATRDLPIAFANWRTRQIKKRRLTQSLEQEMEEKQESLEEDEKENAYIMLPDLTGIRRTVNSEATITVEVEERGNSESLHQKQIDDGAGAENHKSATASEDEEKEDPDTIIQVTTYIEAAKHELTVKDDNESLPVSIHNQHLQPIPSLGGNDEFIPMDLDSDNRVIMEAGDISANVSEYRENLNRVDIAVSQRHPLSCTSGIWPAVSMSDSYYNSTSLNHKYTSAHELSLGYSQVFDKQSARLIDLESDNREEYTVKDLLQRQPNDKSFFNPYTEQEVQDRNQILQHLFKGQNGLPYNHEHKQTQLDFHPASNVSMEPGQFSGHFGEQLHPSLPLESRQNRFNDVYIRQNIQEKMFSDGFGRYAIPRQEHFSSVNVQDWAVDDTHTSAPLQSQLDGGELGRNWFSGEHRVRGGWSGLDAVSTTQSIGNRSITDQSLFGVLSQCNELRPGARYDSMGSNEHFIQSGTYGGVGSLVPTASNVLPQAAHPLNYFSGHESADIVKNNNMGWMNIPHQNSSLQDSMGKPFLRSWNK